MSVQAGAGKSLAEVVTEEFGIVELEKNLIRLSRIFNIKYYFSLRRMTTGSKK